MCKRFPDPQSPIGKTYSRTPKEILDRIRKMEQETK